MNNSLMTTQSTELDFSAIERANLQPSTKAKYKKEIENLVLAGVDPQDYLALQEYADGLKSSRKSFLKSALRLMSQDFERAIKANATEGNIGKVQAGVYRLEAMREAVQVTKHKGEKAHVWLSPKQVTQITGLCGDDLEGKRDWIVLSLPLGAGLRRNELSNLTFDALMQQPTKNGKMRDVLEVEGKGAKSRVIPIKPILAQRLREWKGIVGNGMVVRSLGMNKELGESMSGVAIFNLVNKYGKLVGIDALAPHDLRRTYAQLAYDAGLPITQISKLLGHAKIDTTQKYLNTDLDLDVTASDFIPLAE